MVLGVVLGPGNLEEDNWRPLYFGWPKQSSPATRKEFADFEKNDVQRSSARNNKVLVAATGEGKTEKISASKVGFEAMKG